MPFAIIPKFIIGALLLVITCGAAAGESVPKPADPGLEKRVMALTEDLRCLVCQNQSLADSHADLAIDLKNEIREMLAEGKSEREVIDFLVARYGDFVLYRPPMKATTVLLWFGPLILVVAGFGMLAMRLARRRAAMSPLSGTDRARAESLLKSGEGPAP